MVSCLEAPQSETVASHLVDSETCIKGHRSSTCRHTDRPLFEIKRKGRPVTQCEHCRELRKTKQVHVKCLCEVKEEPPKATSSTFKKKGVFSVAWPNIGSQLIPKIPPFFVAPSKVPETAAFPNGLPEALEASVTFQEGLSSDSDHGVWSTQTPSSTVLSMP